VVVAVVDVVRDDIRDSWDQIEKPAGCQSYSSAFDPVDLVVAASSPLAV